MISLKKYLDGTRETASKSEKVAQGEPLDGMARVYGALLQDMVASARDACPGTVDDLDQKFAEIQGRLSTTMPAEAMDATEKAARIELRAWGHRAAGHYNDKAREVKDLLILMAQTAELVSTRDQRSAGHMSQVTDKLKAIATLDDLTQIRSCIVQSASELRTSIDRMAAEGKAALDQMREKVETYQAMLVEAEEIASRDSLTGLNSRGFAEAELDKLHRLSQPYCVALMDIDNFKRVNDEFGHSTGDELLTQFGTELRSACRRTDVIGRWGGDEFILLLTTQFEEAQRRIARLREWACGEYTLHSRGNKLKLQVHASIGLAERIPGETVKSLVDRADAAMYADKATSRTRMTGTGRPAA